MVTHVAHVLLQLSVGGLESTVADVDTLFHDLNGVELDLLSVVGEEVVVRGDAPDALGVVGAGEGGHILELVQLDVVHVAGVDRPGTVDVVPVVVVPLGHLVVLVPAEEDALTPGRDGDDAVARGVAEHADGADGEEQHRPQAEDDEGEGGDVLELAGHGVVLLEERVAGVGVEVVAAEGGQGHLIIGVVGVENGHYFFSLISPFLAWMS